MFVNLLATPGSSSSDERWAQDAQRHAVAFGLPFDCVRGVVQKLMAVEGPERRKSGIMASMRIINLGSDARLLRVGLALTIAAMLGAAFSPGARAEAPSAYMQRVANQLVAAGKTGSASSFAATFRSHADIPTIGLYSLGPYAKSLPQAERPSFYSGMINFIARYAATEAPKYPVASAIVLGQTEETKTGAYVDSRLTLTSGQTYDVRWWLVRRGQTFKVADAQVLGFWARESLKDLFEKYIAENGGNPRALVIALNR